MKTYISLLKGINVGGHKKILMKDLKEMFVSIGFKNVETYIQSGNVIFQSEVSSTKEISEIISKHIKETFGFDVSVITLSTDELTQAITNNPFNKEELENSYTAFLSNTPTSEMIEHLYNSNTTQDKCIVLGKCVYLHYKEGAGKTKITNDFIEKKLKVTSTTRNWKTCNKLLELAQR